MPTSMFSWFIAPSKPSLRVSSAEGLRVDHLLANRRRLPRKVAARRVDLEELRPVVVEARTQQRHAERSHAALLRELLHHRRKLAHQHGHGDDLLVDAVVRLRRLAPLAAEHAEVGAHARVHHSDVLRQVGSFFSVAITTPFLAFTPRDVLPDATALSAYSIWTSFPDGEKVVSEKEYADSDICPAALLFFGHRRSYFGPK
eukprot:scaffold21718_cov58-Phaeocystis_antarctica.AAC.6